MSIKFHDNLEQGSDEWLAARCGLLTASEMKLILTPKLKISSNDKEKTHLYELLAQRVTQHVEPQYVSDALMRGQVDEITARELYSKNYEPATEVGFITNDEWGFTIGYSPDGIVGDAGLIEIKSRAQKYQMKTSIESLLQGECPEEYMLQVQTGLLVTGRKWCDFISYSGGMNMVVIRVFPNPEVHEAIIAAASAFEQRIWEAKAKYLGAIKGGLLTIQTERTIEQEMTI